MSWNYRVVQFDTADGEKWYEVKEVFYDKDGTPVGYCDATVGSETFAGIIEVLDMMLKDSHKAVLKDSDFGGYNE